MDGTDVGLEVSPCYPSRLDSLSDLIWRVRSELWKGLHKLCALPVDLSLNFIHGTICHSHLEPLFPGQIAR